MYQDQVEEALQKEWQEHGRQEHQGYQAGLHAAGTGGGLEDEGGGSNDHATAD